MFGAFTTFAPEIEARLTELEPSWPELFKRASDLNYAVETYAAQPSFEYLANYEMRLRGIIEQNLAQVNDDIRTGNTWRIIPGLQNILDIVKVPYLDDLGGRFKRQYDELVGRSVEFKFAIPDPTPPPMPVQVIPEPAPLPPEVQVQLTEPIQATVPAVVAQPADVLTSSGPFISPEELATRDAAQAITPSPLPYLVALGGGLWLLHKLFKPSAA